MSAQGPLAVQDYKIPSQHRTKYNPNMTLGKGKCWHLKFVSYFQESLLYKYIGDGANIQSKSY